MVDPDPKKYFYISQGMTTIDNVDDAEEMRLTDEAFDILNFKPVNKHNKINKKLINLNIDCNVLFF